MTLPAERTALPAARSALPDVLEEALAHASGRVHRADPDLPRTGGPAGNAQLTAWIGLLLLGLSLAELVTLLSIRGLIAWHVVIGALLVPPALVKTATTGWRMVRYYARSAPYVKAGPPPLLMRVLGPLVVVTTLGLLATGLTLVGLGQQATYRPIVTVLGFSVSWLTVHQAAFAGWAVATGLHVLGRLLPAFRLVRVPAGVRRDGGGSRVVVLVGTLLAAALLGWFVLGLAGSWTSGPSFAPEGLSVAGTLGR